MLILLISFKSSAATHSLQNTFYMDNHPLSVPESLKYHECFLIVANFIFIKHDKHYNDTFTMMTLSRLKALTPLHMNLL